MVGLFILYPLLTKFNIGNWSGPGEFSDLYAGLNTLFSGIAIALLIGTLVLQCRPPPARQPAVKAGTDGGVARTREVKLGCVFTQSGRDETGRPVRDEGSTSSTGAVEIVDLYHARQHLWELAGKPFPNQDKRRRDWASQLERQLDQGRRIEPLVAHPRGIETDNAELAHQLAHQLAL